MKKQFNDFMDELVAKDIEVSFRECGNARPHYRFFKRKHNAVKFALGLDRTKFYDIVITEVV